MNSITDISPFQAQYYTLLKTIIQDKRNWAFTEFDDGKVVAVMPSPDGHYVCKIKWASPDTFEINFSRSIDKLGKSIFYIKSNNACLLGLADDFKNLYEYRNAQPSSNYIEKLESILSHFVSE